jgi:4-amino-4-deoxy-L-arabinose transferase-like glycosyltransferase
MASSTISVDRRTTTPQSAPFGQRQDSVKPSLSRELLVVALVFIAASWVFFTGLGDVPLFNPDECFYAEPAREMLETRDFITTTLNYDIRYTKPPLHYWATALSYHLFGVDEFAARFFSAMCAAILVASTYCLVNKFVGMRAGLIATGVLLTAPLYVVTGRLAIAEMSLSLFTTGSLFCFYNAFKEKRMSFAWIGYVLLACGMMTKGPVGIVLPVIILGAYHLLRRNFMEALKFYKPHWGALIAAALSLPWYIIETIVTKGEYFTCFIVMENFQRFTNVVSGHKAPWWYHIAAVGGGFLPWSLFLPQAILGALKPEKQPSPKDQPTNRWAILDTYRHLDAKQDLALFAVVLFVTTIAFYSASVSKLLSYTVCCFPALAIAVAIQVDKMINDSKLRNLLIPVAILATVFGIGSLVEPAIIKIIRGAPQNIGPIIETYMLTQLAAFTVAIALMVKGRRTWGVALIGISTLLTTSFSGYQIISAVATKQERGLPTIARFAAASKDPIFVYKARVPSVPFYTRRKTEMSPAQEIPIAGTNRYTGVAGQSQPPKIKFFGLGSASSEATDEDATRQKLAEDANRLAQESHALPKYERLTGADVDAQVQTRKRAYIIAKVNDAADFRNRPGYKQIAQSQSFTLIQWIKPEAAQ